LFARVTLDDAEYALYERVYERVVVDAPKPDLVVYLQAPVDVLDGPDRQAWHSLRAAHRARLSREAHAGVRAILS
jgi:hypothetical protein